MVTVALEKPPATAGGTDLISDYQLAISVGTDLSRPAVRLPELREAARLDPSDPHIAWIGRRARILQGRFAAPLLFVERVTRGRLRYVWPVVALTTIHLHQPVLTAVVFGFWVYSWAVPIYLRIRTGKAPK